MTFRDRKVVELRLPRDAKDDSIQEFVQWEEIEKLSFADSQITEKVLGELKAFPNLTGLDLSRTKITNEALNQLAPFKGLKRLSLAGTRLDVKALSDLGLKLHGLSIQSIDLSDLGIDDEELIRLVKNTNLNSADSYSRSFRLQNNRITDLGVKESFGKTTTQGSLDLAGNPIDGSGFVGHPAILRLNLDRTKITDKTFSPAVATLQITYTLSVRDTELTDAILPLFAGSGIQGLVLGGGRITERGLGANPLSLNQLSLNSKQFTGHFLKSWVASGIYLLDLSGSSADDETIDAIVQFSDLQYLNLASTEITDRALEKLAGKKQMIYRLNLSNTNITAKGLLRAGFSSSQIVDVAIDQFTEQELNQLRRSLNVVVAERWNPYNDEW